MERQVSTATILVIVLVALAAVIGIGFAAFSIAKSSGNDGVQEMATQTDYASKSKFSEFNDKEVTGLMLKNFMDNNKGSHITFVIQTRTFRNPAKITSNRRVIMHNQAVYAVYGKQFEAPDSSEYLTVVSGEEIPKWTGEAYLLERRDGSSLRYNGVYKVQDDFDYTAVHSNGTPEYIDDSAAFLCNLIYDNGDNIVGIIAKQKNKPGATTKESSVFAADSVLEHINKTDGGNIPLGGLVVWGESGGKQTLIREDGKAGQGFGEVGLSKDKVDTSMYDSIADNETSEFVFEDLERTILIGYKGNSSQIKIPETVTYVKSLTSDGSNSVAFKNNLKNVSAIIFNAGCVKIENLDLSICPNIYSVYVSPTTTVISGKKLNMVQMEAPKHLKAQIQACREGTVFVNDWDKKLYNCGCPACQISANDWVYVWDGLDIVGYVGTLPKNLEVPLGCTGLGPRALAGGQFETITLPNSLKYIGKEAFYECQNVKSVDMSACSLITEIPDKTFYNCDGIYSVNLPVGVTKIGGYAFYDCDALKYLNNFGTVKNVGDYCFYGSAASYFDDVSNVETVGTYGMGYCYLGYSNFPTKLTSIRSYAFAYAYSYSSGPLKGVITIPGTLETIPSCAFYYFSAKTIYIEDGVKTIGSKAFGYNPSLYDVYIPASVTSIASDAFYNSPKVRLHFAEGSIFAGDYGAVYNADYTVLIKGPTELTASDTFTIRDTCKEIAAGAFSNCTLGKLVIPDSVTKIGSTAFEGLKGCSEITLGKNITTLGERLFGDSSSVTKLNIHPECKISWSTNPSYLRKATFLRTIETNGNPLLEVTEDGLVYLKNSTGTTSSLMCVLGGSTAKSVTLIDSCKYVASYALYRNTSITSLNLNNCTVLYNDALTYAYGLKNIYGPKLTTIHSKALYYVNYGNAVTIDFPALATVNNTSFLYVSADIKFSSSLSYFSKAFADTGYTIYPSDTRVTSVDMSDCSKIKTLSSESFTYMNYCKSIILPSTLEIIKEKAFFSISKAMTIEIPSSVQTIEAGAFDACSGISLKAPSHLKSQNSNDRWGIPNSRITWY